MLHPQLFQKIDPTRPFSYSTEIRLGTVSQTDQKADKILIADEDFICTHAAVVVSYQDPTGNKGAQINEFTTARDRTTIYLKRSSAQKDLMQRPLPVSAFNAIYGSETFLGWELPQRSEITVDILNQVLGTSNYSLPVIIEVILSGYIARRQ